MLVSSSPSSRGGTRSRDAAPHSPRSAYARHHRRLGARKRPPLSPLPLHRRPRSRWSSHRRPNSFALSPRSTTTRCSRRGRVARRSTPGSLPAPRHRRRPQNRSLSSQHPSFRSHLSQGSSRNLFTEPSGIASSPGSRDVDRIAILQPGSCLAPRGSYVAYQAAAGSWCAGWGPHRGGRFGSWRAG